MSNVVTTLTTWARLTRGCLEARASRHLRSGAQEPGDDGVIYRLRHWPSLPSSVRTADVFRLLSVMSHRAVNRRWMLANTRLQAPQVEALLRRLVARGDVEVIDLRRLPAIS